MVLRNNALRWRFTALVGALVNGYALPAPGLPAEYPPGMAEAFWVLPGSMIALGASYVWGSLEPE